MNTDFNYARFYGSIVRIICESLQTDWLFPYIKNNVTSSIGSGFFIAHNLILTCSHVVESATFVHVEIPSEGKKKHVCKIKAICPFFDIALIEIEDYACNTFCELEKNTDSIQPGDETIALGFPLGQTNLKITNGIISGQQDNCLQIDTPINPGNSGGPLIRKNKVIGINSAGIFFSQNVGYSVPIERFFSIKHLFEKPGYNQIVHFPETFGFQFQNINSNYNDYMSTRCKNNGVLITKIIPNSLIAQTTLKKGDILCSIHGKEVDQFGELNHRWMNQKMTFDNLLVTIRLDTDVEIQYWRGASLKKERFRFTTHKFPVRLIYPLFEDIEYIIYAGLIIMPLNLNILKNISPPSKKASDLKLLRYQFHTHQHKTKIVMGNILNGSLISQLDIFTIGETVKTINGVKIRSMDDVRKAILLKPSYVNITNEDGISAILRYSDLVKEYAVLSARYNFPIIHPKSRRRFSLKETGISGGSVRKGFYSQ